MRASKLTSVCLSLCVFAFGADAAYASAAGQRGHKAGKRSQVRHHTGHHRKRSPRRPAAVPKSLTTTQALPASVTSSHAANAPAPIGPCANADLVPTSNNIALIQAATSCLINQERAKAGLGALSDNSQLLNAAVGHSRDMVVNDYFSHTSPTGSTFDQRIFGSGYVSDQGAYTIGENIAFATGDLATPASIVSMWMNSPEHKANILTADFRDSGMGVVYGAPPSLSSGQPGATYTQDFGARG
jgi:uncharacterized protein YkwD